MKSIFDVRVIQFAYNSQYYEFKYREPTNILFTVKTFIAQLKIFVFTIVSIIYTYSHLVIIFRAFLIRLAYFFLRYIYRINR